MVQVGVGQQQVVDGSRIKAEVVGIVLFQFTATLVEAAVNEDALAGTFQQVTGTGDTLCRTMKGKPHGLICPGDSGGIMGSPDSAIQGPVHRSERLCSC